ncbi:glycosyltransferase family 4 protein [Myxococcota bacterium]|nr:glycosyltransferase family 4 protein [Myxococcota bacterium]MBU1379338.1 glycosyltransferase family 4 protein [Myxococcota bacterium]MBU1497058.1 glycosyltransferase family 4 protein [Myxococcota bacterium]
MKIAFLINNLGSGGAEKLLLDICIELKKKSVQFDVFTLTESYIYINDFKNNGIEIKSLSLINSPFDPMILPFLLKKLENYNIFHVHLFPSFYWAALVSLFNNEIRIICTEHNSNNNRRKRKFFPFEKFAYSRMSQAIAISPSSYSSAIKWMPLLNDKICLIPNGIVLNNFYNATPTSPEVFGFSSKDIIISCVARLRFPKDHHTLIKALKFLPSEYKLVIAGEGPQLNELVSLSSSYNINDRINFAGFCKDIAGLYKLSRVNVLATESEGFGLVAVEAMASGTPFIGSDLEVLKWVAGDAGIFFQNGNSVQLAEKIRMTCENEAFRKEIIAKGYENAKRFSIETMAEKHIELYKKLLEE